MAGQLASLAVEHTVKLHLYLYFLSAIFGVIDSEPC